MIYIDVHSHSAIASPDTVKIVNNDSAVSGFFSAGLHPWKLSAETLENSLAALEKRLRLPSCVALGEAGLDKICATAWELQTEAFKRQIEFAEHYGKPLIIHCVRAAQEVLELKKKSRVPWIFHGFRSSPESAESLVKKGFYLSLGAPLLDCEKTRNAFRAVPAEHIFFETDESTVSIKEIYSEAVKLKDIQEKELCDTIKNNFINVFGDILK